MSISYDESDGERVKTVPAFKAQILCRIARMDAAMPITAGRARYEIELEHKVLQWVLSHLEDINNELGRVNPIEVKVLDLRNMINDISKALEKY